ncbi:MAG: nucleotidyltransferase domain-containing protein [Elusimicrobiota bacterium]|jgi:predicted nucleotidyltransferase|nr:nucleotidyltransferase domain-containing protein [Elusimicrobiota bacterium]
MAKKSDLIIAKKKAFKYAEILKANMKVNKLYLFGSYVSATNHIDSDIDIAVVSDDLKGDCISNRVKLMLLCDSVDNMIEPHPFISKEFTKRDPFVKEIVKTGIRII